MTTAADTPIEALRQRRAAAMATETGPFFMGLPDRWFDDVTWRCTNGHISKCFLKSEVKGDLCLACGAAVLITFPEDVEDTASSFHQPRSPA